MELFQWLTATTTGRCIFTMLVSMIPVIELRGGLPFGVALGLPDYQADMVFLTQEQQNKRAEEVAAKEKEVAELRSKYFGPEGELYKKRQSLMKPIQENIYNAVKAVSEERKYQVIFDRASSQSIIFASPTIDVSNEVLAKLGFSK